LGLGAVAMAVVVVFLFGAGWSLALAADGAALAAVAVALAFGISNLWHLNFTQSGFQAGDAWRPQAATPGLTLLAETLSSQSLAYSGRRDSLPIAFTSPASSQVAWRLREFPSSSSFSPEQVQQPPVVLALEGSTPPLASEYMGQSITVAERWNWLGVLPTDPVTWMVLRQTPTFPERWLLLMRTDIATLGQTDREPAP
jgi:hypothetical protein